MGFQVGVQKWVTTALIGASIGFLLTATARAEGVEKTKYVRGAFALGLPSADVGEWGTQYGFSGAIGFQPDAVWATDLEFTWTGGGNISGTSLDTSAWAVVWNARLYPLPLLGSKGDGRLRPYALAGFGAGNIQVGPPSTDTTSFVINLGLGADLMLGKDWGLYAEVANKFHTGDSLFGVFNGVTNFNFGALFHF